VKKLARIRHPEGERGGVVSTRGRGQQPENLFNAQMSSSILQIISQNCKSEKTNLNRKTAFPVFHKFSNVGTLWTNK
jgi:hypothetical protein